MMRKTFTSYCLLRKALCLLRKALCLLLAWVLLTAPLLHPSVALAWGAFTHKDEKELGDKFNALIRSRMPIVQDTEIVDYVTGVVNRLAASLPPQPFPFKASVLRHNAVNAFAIPGGYIFIHTGLILAMSNESEVAGVIAHEMAHVTQRHIASRIENSQYISILSLIGALAGAFLGGQGGSAAMVGSMAAGQAAMLNYSRTDEREADQVGMNFLTQAGYPAQGMVGAFEVLSRRQWLLGGDIPSYLSTHPDLQERVRDMGVRVSRLAPAKQSQRDDNSRFLRVQALIRARYADPQTAQQAFARQLEGPNRCLALMGMGVLCSRRNEINDATRFFDQALTCSPDDTIIMREAGRFHYLKGDKNRGFGLLRQTVQRNSNDVLALFYYARCLGDIGSTDEAIDYARQVLRKVPDDSEVHDLLARLYGAKRQLFSAHLHMAYSALYANNERKTQQNLDKAKGLVKDGAQKSQVERFEKLLKERKEYMK